MKRTKTDKIVSVCAFCFKVCVCMCVRAHTHKGKKVMSKNV